MNWDGMSMEENALEALVNQAFERYGGSSNHKDNENGWVSLNHIKCWKKDNKKIRVISGQLKAKYEIQMISFVVYEDLGGQWKLRIMPRNKFSVYSYTETQ